MSCFVRDCKRQVYYDCNCEKHDKTCEKHVKAHNLECNSHLLLLENHELSINERSKRNLYCACNYLVSKITEVYNNQLKNIDDLGNSINKEQKIATTDLNMCIENISKVFSINLLPPEMNESENHNFKKSLTTINELRRLPTLRSVIERGDNLYDGTWYDENNLNGYGKVTTGRGDVYLGDVVNGLFEGTGLVVFASGQRYEGKFEKGKRNGFGKNTWSNGDRFEGEFNDGKIEGKGKFFYANGDVFEGNFSNNSREGQGIYTYSDGDSEEGNWEKNKLEGLVIRKIKNKVTTALYKEGKFIRVTQ